jgi:hypothetical protein
MVLAANSACARTLRKRLFGEDWSLNMWTRTVKGELGLVSNVLDEFQTHTFELGPP